MNFKIRLKEYHFNKILDYISSYDKAKNGVVSINDEFYNGIKHINKVKVNQILNAMEAENIIEIFPPNNENSAPTLCLTSYAFLYRYKNFQSKKRFYITTTISIIALIKAFDKECLLLLKLLKQLLK